MWVIRDPESGTIDRITSNWREAMIAGNVGYDVYGPPTSSFNNDFILQREPAPEPEAPTVDIPKDAYPKSFAGLPDWIKPEAESFIKSFSGQLRANVMPNLTARLGQMKPFAWWDAMTKTRDWYTGATQGTRNQLLRALQQRVAQNTSAAANTLNTRGFLPVSPAASRAIWHDALNAYAQQMAAMDQWAAQQAAALAQAMAQQQAKDYATMGAIVHDTAQALAQLLTAARIATYEDPSRPWALMLSQWG